MSSLYDEIEHVVKLSTNRGGHCKHCDFKLHSFADVDNLADAINHYIAEHGYRLLHVGTETDRDDEELTWHSTVAVLGR
jgi:hypothetical protein